MRTRPFAAGPLAFDNAPLDLAASWNVEKASKATHVRFVLWLALTNQTPRSMRLEFELRVTPTNTHTLHTYVPRPHIDPRLYPHERLRVPLYLGRYGGATGCLCLICTEPRLDGKPWNIHEDVYDLRLLIVDHVSRRRLWVPLHGSNTLDRLVARPPR